MDSFNVMKEFYKNEFEIDESISKTAQIVENECRDIFAKIDEIKEYNQLKVIKAMQQNKLSDSHFAGSTGYGYGDTGRDTLTGFMLIYLRPKMQWLGFRLYQVHMPWPYAFTVI